MESVTQADPDRESIRIAYSPQEAADALGCCRGFIYSLMATGQLSSIKLGGRRFIRASTLTERLAEAN